jgi:hypothetical protein
MKRLVFIVIIFLLSFSLFSQTKDDEKKLILLSEHAELLKGKIYSTRDDFYNITWIHDISYKDFEILADKIYLYIGISKNPDKFYCRLVIEHNYTSSYVLNIQEYHFNIDGQNAYFKPKYDEVKLDIRRYGTTEEIDINISGRSLESLLGSIAFSKKTIIRYKGISNFTDREITKSEKDGLHFMLLAYNYLLLGGKIENILQEGE